MSDASTTRQNVDGWLRGGGRLRAPRTVLTLVVVWSMNEPERVGEAALLAGSAPQMLGRGGPLEGDPAPRLQLARHRPGAVEPTGPLASRGISRRHVIFTPSPAGVAFEQRGQADVLWNGVPASSGTLRAGDTLSIRDELVLYATPRPAPWEPRAASRGQAPFAFGAPDGDGIVGESVNAWALRDDVALAAEADAHVLVLGESGTGKELVARALHRRSARSTGPFVARSAVSFPATLIDAELFGSARHFPNPGMPERDGLVGAADRGVLFLDEVGEMPEELQAHLLRVLDGTGEYHRLGTSHARTSNFRLVAATNRDVEHLKHDFAARMPMRITAPSLDDRREDVPLLVRVLLERAAEAMPSLRARFFEPGGRAGAFPRLAPAFVDALVRHAYVRNVRELEEIVWASVREANAGFLDVPSLLRRKPEPMAPPVAREEPTRDEVLAALRAHGGNRTHAAKALGMTSRYALRRLAQKLGIDAVDPPAAK